MQANLKQLAIEGGTPVRTHKLPYGRQWINEDDIEAVVKALRSDWLTQGPVIEQFEQAIAEYCGAKYAVAVSNGTAALHLACLAARLGPGDTLWTSPNTFVASANCSLYCGAQPDFVDIDPRTYNMNVAALKAKLSQAEQERRLPKIVAPVHFAGQSCEMEAIYALSQQYGFMILEDASHAIGGRYKDKPVGSCEFSDMAVFSFHPVKIITTGEGGMILTNNEELYQKLLRLRTHGITRNPKDMEGESEGNWYYQQIELGFNYRITDIQAALGLSQLQRIDGLVARRHELVQRYNQALADLPINLPYQHPDAYSAFHLYVIRLRLNEIQKTRKEVFDALRQKKIGVNVHYIPVHTQPYYRKLGFSTGDYPEAETYYKETITLPLYPAMSEDDQNYVSRAIRTILS